LFILLLSEKDCHCEARIFSALNPAKVKPESFLLSLFFFLFSLVTSLFSLLFQDVGCILKAAKLDSRRTIADRRSDALKAF